AAATRGVVLLDEIGDLPPALQPKLLTVLTRAPVCPVGGEGNADHAYVFEGLTIAATWRDLEDIRPDLLSRLSDHLIRIPPLRDRVEDLPLITEVMISDILRERRDRIARIRKIDGVDGARLAAEEGREFTLNDNDRIALAE